MKKLISIVAVAMMMIFATVPAFAVEDISVDSPVATQPSEKPTVAPGRDDTPTSPQTGSNDLAAYAVMAVSLAAVGTASVMVAKTSKKSK